MDPGQDVLMSGVTQTADDEDQCLGEGEGDGVCGLYSTVKKLVDRRGVDTPRCSMKNGQLPQKTDQNQTFGGGSNPSSQTTLQSRILQWEGIIQSGILTDDSTETCQQSRSRGLTAKTNNNKGS